MKYLITLFTLLISLTVSSQTIETTKDTITTIQKTYIVKINSPISEGSPYTIYTGSGVQVTSGKVKDSQIDITSLKNGFYYIIVGGKTIMIVKD